MLFRWSSFVYVALLIVAASAVEYLRFHVPVKLLIRLRPPLFDILGAR